MKTLYKYEYELGQSSATGTERVLRALKYKLLSFAERGLYCNVF